MDKLKAMTAFVCIAQHSSLTRAARELRTSLPTAVRTLAALEAELGLRLVNRTTRRLALTEEGNEYAAHCRAVLASIAEGEVRLSERRFVARGHVVATAPGPFGRRFVVPAITEFLAAQPRISIELLLLDRVVNLLEEGVDLAVRVGHLPDSSLIALRVGATRQVICASPRYLAEHGRPKRPKDLASHACLRLIGSGSGHDWMLRHGGRTRRVSVAGRFDSNQRDAQLLACEQGLGLGQFLDYQVADALREGRLERVLEPYEPAPLPIHVVYPQGHQASARVRALSSFLVERLRARDRALGA